MSPAMASSSVPALGKDLVGLESLSQEQILMIGIYILAIYLIN